MPFTYRDPSALQEMSNEQLVESLKSLAGGIVRELKRRGYEVSLSVPDDVAGACGSDEALEVQLRHPVRE